jgi:diacylglycerol kinase (ATP)
MKSNKKGIKRILSAFTYSYNGFISAFKSEEAFRQDLLICLILSLVAIFLPVSTIEKIILFSSLFLVLLMELTNTAIEVVIDRISDDFHPLSKIAKDIGSCLVLISFLHLVLIWGIILYNNFTKIFIIFA